MNKRIAFAFLTTLFLSTASQAQLFRAYLAPSGSDANACTLVAPCRLLPAALAAVADGGEIWMLDSANYNAGNVTVVKSVTILAVPGAVGSFVTLNGGPALTIQSPAEVSLRNIVVVPLTGAVAGNGGILVSGATLTIEDSLVAGVPGNGIQVDAGTLRVSDTTIRNTTGHAIFVGEFGAALIARTRMIDNTAGVMVNALGNSAMGTVTNSVITGNGVAATATAATDGRARLVITGSTIDRAGTALAVFTSGTNSVATLTIGDNLIVNANTGWTINGSLASILSRGDNQMIGNGGSIGALGAVAAE